jgi:hypothetical protein
MTVKLAMLFIGASMISISCGDNGSSPGPDFIVRVLDYQGQPLDGAYIEGGIDWDHFIVVTDNNGEAIVPGHARNNRVTIYKNNYFSLIENYLSPDDYILDPTPFILTEIGEIEGDVIRFDPGRILSVTYQGNYHVYDYNDNNVIEIATAEFPYQVKNFKLYDDTLWYTTHENGMYVYSINDPFNPEQLFHLDISGYLKPFARKDSIVVVGPLSSPGPIRVFSHRDNGTVDELDRIGDFSVGYLTFISYYLIKLQGQINPLMIFDLSDPSDIRFVYSDHYDGYSRPFMYGDTLVLRSTHGNAWYGHGYLEIDLSDPANPLDLDGFTARGRIEDIVDDSTAVGRYYYHDSALSVFRRDPQGDFEPIAIASEFYGYKEHQGCNPPYFVIGDRLWKMEER